MTSSPFPVISPTTKSKRRGKSLRTALAVAAVLGLLATFVVVRNAQGDPSAKLTAIFVEPRSAEPASLTGTINAELDSTKQGNPSILVGGVLDGSDATTFVGTFACPSSVNSLACESRRTDTRHHAATAADALLQAPRPAQVDLFSAFRVLADHLEANPAPGGVEVFLDVSGRQDVGTIHLGGPGAASQVDATVKAIRDAGLFPADTKGWVVHLVMPTSGDPATDQAVAAVINKLLQQSGGTLATTGQRWLGEAQTLKLQHYARGVTGSKTGRVTTISLGQTLFDTGSSGLRADASAALDAVVTQIRSLDHIDSIQIAGYADSTGTPEVNQALSTTRAQSVGAALAQRLRVDPRTISSQGYGSLPDDGSVTARQANRRVDVIVTAG